MSAKQVEPVVVDIAFLHELYRYDPETGHIYLRNTRKGHPAGTRAGALQKDGYVRVMAGNKKVMAHRVAWALHYGYWPPQVIDHINMERSDNRICNLRLATISQNTAYSRTKSVSGRRGVQPESGCDKWRARIKKGGKQINLGLFATLDEAAHAYNKAAIELYGEFAVLNPIGGDKESAALAAAPAQQDRQEGAE